MTRYLKYVHRPSHSTLVPKVKTIYINNVDKTLDCFQQKPLHQSHLISYSYIYIYKVWGNKTSYIRIIWIDRMVMWSWCLTPSQKVVRWIHILLCVIVRP